MPLQSFYYLNVDNTPDYSDEFSVAEEIDRSVELLEQELEIVDVAFDLVKGLPYHHCQWVYTDYSEAKEVLDDLQATAQAQEGDAPERLKTLVFPDGHLIVAQFVESSFCLVYAPLVKELSD